jgi:hypothetical protein
MSEQAKVRLLVQRMIKVLRSKKYQVFYRPYELNIVGVRNANPRPNQFDDQLHIFYKVSNDNWVYGIYSATTDPGTYWLNNPLSPQGTAILQEGQYLNAYAVDWHRGKYKALCQRKEPVNIIRDYDRDTELDFTINKVISGYFGINIHRANKSGITYNVDKHSAGCQVFQNAADFDTFMSLCEQHKKLYGNLFTYTLIDLRELKRTFNRKKVLVAGSAATAAAGLAFTLIS